MTSKITQRALDGLAYRPSHFENAMGIHVVACPCVWLLEDASLYLHPQRRVLSDVLERHDIDWSNEIAFEVYDDA